MTLQFLDATTISMGEIFLTVLAERLSDTGDIWGEKPRLHINGITFRRRESDQMVIPIVETYVILGGLYKNGNYYKVSPFGDVPGKYDYQHKLCFYSLNPTTYRKICEQRIRDALSEIILHQRDYLPERMCGVTVQQTSLAHEVSLQTSGHNAHSMVVVITPAIEGAGIPEGVREPVLRNEEFERLHPTWLLVPCSRRPNELQSWNITFQPLEASLLQRSAALQQSVLFLTWTAEKLGWSERGLSSARVFTSIASIQLHVSNGAFANERFTIQVKVLLMQLRSHLQSKHLEDFFVIHKNLLETLPEENLETIQSEVDEILQNMMQTPSAVEDYIRTNYPYYIARGDDENLSSSGENLVVQEILEKNANFSLPENEESKDKEQEDELVYYEEDEEFVSDQGFLVEEPLEEISNQQIEVKNLSSEIVQIGDFQDEQKLEELQKEVITMEIFAKGSSEVRLDSEFGLEPPLHMKPPTYQKSKSSTQNMQGNQKNEDFQDNSGDIQDGQTKPEDTQDNEAQGKDQKYTQPTSFQGYEDLQDSQSEQECLLSYLSKSQDLVNNQSQSLLINQTSTLELPVNRSSMHSLFANPSTTEDLIVNRSKTHGLLANPSKTQNLVVSESKTKSLLSNQSSRQDLVFNQSKTQGLLNGQTKTFDLLNSKPPYLQHSQSKTLGLIDIQNKHQELRYSPSKAQNLLNSQSRTQNNQDNRIYNQELEGSQIHFQTLKINQINQDKQNEDISTKPQDTNRSSSGDIFDESSTRVSPPPMISDMRTPSPTDSFPTMLEKSPERDNGFIANGTPVLLNGTLEHDNGVVASRQESSATNGLAVTVAVDVATRSPSIMEIMGSFHHAFIYSVLAFIVVSLGIAWMMSTDVESSGGVNISFPNDNTAPTTSDSEL